MKLILIQVPDRAFEKVLRDGLSEGKSTSTQALIFQSLSKLFGEEVGVCGIFEGGISACPDAREYTK